jgi:hypothetical protein
MVLCRKPMPVCRGGEPKGDEDAGVDDAVDVADEGVAGVARRSAASAM